MYWEEVIKTPDYQTLSNEERLKWRKEYFDDIIKPQIKSDEYDSMWRDFNTDADTMEGKTSTPLTLPDNGWTNEIANLPPQFREEIMKKAERDKGFLDAMINGRFGSTTAALTKAYLPDTASGKGVKRFEESGWQPETSAERIGYGLGSIAADIPLYAMGGEIVGPAAGAIMQSAGAFALPGALKKMTELKEKDGGDVDLSIANILEVAEEMGREGAKGGAVGLAGLPGKSIAAKLGGGKLAKLTGEAVSMPAETAALLGAEKVLNNQPVTGETALETLGTIGILKLAHSIPIARTSIEKAKEKGIPEERIAENLKGESIESMKDPAIAKEAVDRAILMTEEQIAAERVKRIQDEIIDTQIRANFKDGKTAREILQINQVPKEYRTYILDQTDTGGYRYKPDVLQRIDDIINQKDPFLSQKYEDILPNPLRDMGFNEGEKLYGKFNEVTSALDEARTNLKHWEEQRPTLHESYMTEAINKLTGNYRRYEHLPQTRDRMDQVIDYALSVLTPEERFRVMLEPSTLMDHIDSKESGYSSLKKPYRDAIQKEIVAKIIKETSFIPPHVIDSAIKTSDFKIHREGKKYLDEVTKLESGVKSIQSNSDYRSYLKHLEKQQKTDIQIESELSGSLEKIEAWTDAMRKEHQVNLQKALGESPEFGELNRSNVEYFGKDHMRDLMEFAVRSPDELSVSFEKANYLEREFKHKGWSPDLFLNKSRFIANKLGDKVYKNFVIPLRQSEHNFVVESQKYKDWIKDTRKDFNSKQREEIGEYLISQMEQGKATLNDMGRKAKAFEELTREQQEAVTDIRNILDVMYERINAARVESGLEPLSKVDDYFTFLRKFSLLEELGYDPMRVSKEQFESSEITGFKTRGFAFQFAKERIQSTRALETDAFYVLDKYLTGALRTAHMTPIIGKLRTALDINDRFALTNPHAHKYLHDTLDYVSGKKISEAANWINTVANKVNHNLGTFILTYNFHSIGVQPSAVVNTIGVLGPHAVCKGLRDFMNRDMQKLSMDKSKVLKARMHDVTIEEMTKGFTGKAGKVKAAAAELGTLPLRYLDLKTAQVSWLSGYRYGKEQLKLTDREAVVFADDIVINSQGSASRIDLAPVQHTPLGKSLTLFNTFVINNLNFLTDDILGIRKANRLIAEGVTKSEASGYTGSNQVSKITGRDQYNIYERNTLHSTREGLEKLITLAAAGFVCNTIYEAMGVKSPLPAPLSAAYEGFTGQSWIDALQGKQPTRKEEQLTGALKESLKEFLSLIPVSGGSFRYGGDSVFGAVGGLVGETFDTLAEKPASKPLAYIVTKWVGVPGGQQVYKILKQLSKERKAEEKEQRRAMNPAEYMKRDLRKNNPYYQQKQELRKQMRGY